MPKEKLALYKDKECKDLLDDTTKGRCIGDANIGETTKISIYARNEGDTNFEKLKVTIGRKDVEVEGGDRKILKPDEIWRFTLVFKIDKSAEVRLLRDELDIYKKATPIEKE